MVEQIPVSNQDPHGRRPGNDHSQDDLSFWERWGELFVAAGVLILGIVVLVETQGIRVRQGVVVSPRIIPQVVGVGLVLIAIWYAVDVLRNPHRGDSAGEDAEDADPEVATDWGVLGIIAIALIAYAILMRAAGFVVASVTLFTVSSFAMGSRRVVRDVILGVMLAVGVFLLFNGWLGVRLPGGWLEGLL